MKKDPEAKDILNRIQELAKRHEGRLSIRNEADNTGTGYISLPNETEITFDFEFTGSYFNIDVRESKQAFSRFTSHIDYSNKREVASIILLLEKWISNLYPVLSGWEMEKMNPHPSIQKNYGP